MIRAVIAAAALLLGAQSALASGPVEIVPGEPFTHERTDTIFPGEIGGLKLTRMHDFSDASFDLAAIYGGMDDGDEMSVYLYRAGLPDVSLWFGQVQRYMMMRQAFTPVEGADLAPRFFAPAGSAVESAIRLTYPTEGGDITSTGAVVLPRGDWLFKIRASSKTRSVAELDSLIDAALAAVPIPPELSAPEAYPVTSCPDTLDLPGAQRAPETAATGMTAIMGLMAVDTASGRDEARQVLWCRDAGSPEDNPVFRPDERKDAYVITLQDAGAVVSVGHPEGFSGQPALPEAGQPIPVMFRNSTSDYLLALFTSVPTPQQALATLDAGQILASYDREGNIRLNSGLGN